MGVCHHDEDYDDHGDWKIKIISFFTEHESEHDHDHDHEHEHEHEHEHDHGDWKIKLISFLLNMNLSTSGILAMTYIQFIFQV